MWTLFQVVSLSLTVAAGVLKHPHIVFILVDDLGWNDVSMHGSHQIPTPVIDSLAKEGVRLNNYYVNPVCSPTRASLMTGRSVFHHGIFTPYGEGDDAEGLNLTYTLLPEHLKQQFGYKDYMVGKWHLGMKNKQYLPSSRGFDKFIGYYSGVMDYWKHFAFFGLNITGLDFHQGGSDFGLRNGEEIPLWNTSGLYSSDLFANIASDWIKNHSQTNQMRPQIEDPDPMFLYLPFQGVHSGDNRFVQAPNDLIEKFESISPNHTCGQWEPPQTGQCTKSAMRKTIAAGVTSVDDAIGKVVQALKDADMFEDTLLIISTDNGGPTDGMDNNMMNNFPLRGCKGGYFEGGVRGVGVMHGPNVLQKSGYVSETMHHVTDWVPTLLTAASQAFADRRDHNELDKELQLRLKEGEIPFRLGDGVDNWHALTTGSPSKVRTEICHVTQAEGSVYKSVALRQGDMKIIWHPGSSDCAKTHSGWYPPPGLAWNYTEFTIKCGGPPPSQINQCTEALPCLFNISADPCEFHNLASAMPDVVLALRARLKDFTATAVLPWNNFAHPDIHADPAKLGPTTPITPDHQQNGPHTYQGVFGPWLTDEQEKQYYPSHYKGPGYPPETKYEYSVFDP